MSDKDNAAGVQQGKPSHLTDEETTAIAEFASDLMGFLRLPQWTILIMEDPCDEDCNAEIDPVEGKYVARLYLSADWMEKDEAVRLNTVVHEVCHLLHARVSDAVSDAHVHMHSHEYGPWWTRYKRETEFMVDHLAFFLTNHSTVREAWDRAHGRAE